MATAAGPADEHSTAVDAFAERLFAAGLGALELLNVELGTRLGLYERLAALGAVTADQLAEAVGISERYVREWLEQQTVAGMVEVDNPAAEPRGRRFISR